MTIYLDDDSASRQLLMVLRKDGHEVSIPADSGTSGAPDPVHLVRAIGDGRVLLTRNARDFRLLHDLVRASGGRHPGILLFHFDNDAAHDLTPRGVATAIIKLESTGVENSNELQAFLIGPRRRQQPTVVGPSVRQSTRRIVQGNTLGEDITIRDLIEGGRRF